MSNTPTQAAPEQFDKKTRIKSILGGSAGNLVEWYDWYVYAAFTLYFAPQFFPEGDSTVKLLQAAAVFALGFLMRPIGAWIMGIYADRKGRKAGLTISVSLMCIGSLMIACAPTYDSAGMLAPAILLLARLLQGLSVGGEYGASATYLTEMAGKNHRGFFSSFQYVTLISGQLLALCVLIILQRNLSEQALGEWGWRIPFFIGALLAIVVFWIRRGLVETQSSKEAQAQAKNGGPKSGALALFTKYPKQAFTVIMLTAGGTLAFNTFTTYLQKYLVNTSGFEKTTATEITTAAIFIFMLIQPAVGALSDKIGRKPIMIAFGVLGVLFTVPIFNALSGTTDAMTAFFLCMSAMVIVTGYTAINAVVKAELFPPHIRALGVALPYAIANTVFGGTAELVALSFKSAGHENYFFYYITFMIGLSLLTYVFMKDTKKHSMITDN
ncbi:alpha-ketoglutarate permease [Acinetobacter pragensis]|uniref:Alpha-ketoglutarate permease n=1 Tax=Acinetobacter pragensis TaxID=1806892 RepID=A0A151Y267_9GAMM|nr:alpha-ketoglutarate permease [Acinetobacter pragensis]